MQIARIALSLALLSSWVQPAAAQDGQRHILDAGINLGWAAGIVESDGGVTPSNQAEVGGDLARAREHVAALRGQVASPPYDRSHLTAIEQQLGRLAGRIGGMPQGEATRELYQIRRNFRDALRVILSAQTGRLQRAGTCDASILDVGFYFGLGHTAIQRGNSDVARRARDSMGRAIADGERVQRRLVCPFDAGAYRGLPMMGEQTEETYRRSLPRAQQATARAAAARGATSGGSGGGPTTSATGGGRSAGPPSRGSADSGAGPRPDIACVWRSSYGEIHWSEGWYGNRTKTLRGSLRVEDGQWVYRGTWGRTDSPRSGAVVLTFDSPRTFRGYWTEGASGRQTSWTGSSSCY